MSYWSGLPYEPINENLLPQRRHLLNRINPVVIVIVIIFVVVVLVSSVTAIVLKAKQKHVSSQLVSTSTVHTATNHSITRPILPGTSILYK